MEQDLIVHVGKKFNHLIFKERIVLVFVKF